eukprot:CAMPEP_0198425602 /NCGR_PEP_ID=MMETSP1452-20131203/4668_1 /TAXON_ID=1181717 /ORGANISM="Synchroma pusillum, Strain CCMP3072" /LENGTH=870 /DNA_ID=CAMNT_0044145959 /DNA_START=38 /DNA_END=2647 /DNA_ORIENTATION=+
MGTRQRAGLDLTIDLPAPGPGDASGNVQELFSPEPPALAADISAAAYGQPAPWRRATSEGKYDEMALRMNLYSTGAVLGHTSALSAMEMKAPTSGPTYMGGPEMSLAYVVAGVAGCTVRESKDQNSAVVQMLEKGTVVDVAEVQGRRARLTAPVKGWCSIHSETGFVILTRFEGKRHFTVVREAGADATASVDRSSRVVFTAAAGTVLQAEAEPMTVRGVVRVNVRSDDQVGWVSMVEPAEEGREEERVLEEMYKLSPDTMEFEAPIPIAEHFKSAREAGELFSPPASPTAGADDEYSSMISSAAPTSALHADLLAALDKNISDAATEAVRTLDETISADAVAAPVAAAVPAEAKAPAPAPAPAPPAVAVPVASSEEDAAAAAIQRIVRGAQARMAAAREVLGDEDGRLAARLQKLQQLLTQGVEVVCYTGRHPRNGTPRRMVLWSATDQGATRICCDTHKVYHKHEAASYVRGLWLADVAEVRAGADTWSFRSARTPPSNETLCMTLIGSERCIAIEFNSPLVQQFFVTGLSTLCELRVEPLVKQQRGRSNWALRNYRALALIGMRITQEDIIRSEWLSRMLEQGFEIWAVTGSDGPQMRVLWLDWGQKRIFLHHRKEARPGEGCDGLDLSDLSEVRPGRSTTTLLRHGNDSDAKRYVSLIGGERSFHLMCPSARAAKLLTQRMQCFLRVFGRSGASVADPATMGRTATNPRRRRRASALVRVSKNKCNQAERWPASPRALLQRAPAAGRGQSPPPPRSSSGPSNSPGPLPILRNKASGNPPRFPQHIPSSPPLISRCMLASAVVKIPAGPLTLPAPMVGRLVSEHPGGGSPAGLVQRRQSEHRAGTLPPRSGGRSRAAVVVAAAAAAA